MTRGGDLVVSFVQHMAVRRRVCALSRPRQVCRLFQAGPLTQRPTAAAAQVKNPFEEQAVVRPRISHPVRRL